MKGTGCDTVDRRRFTTKLPAPDEGQPVDGVVELAETLDARNRLVPDELRGVVTRLLQHLVVGLTDATADLDRIHVDRFRELVGVVADHAALADEVAGDRAQS